MSTVEEIEEAMEKLSDAELLEIRHWLDERLEGDWDRQISRDVLAGRLDGLAAGARAEHRSGTTLPFPPDEEPSDA